MFTNGPRSQSTAEYARNRASRQLTAAARYEANAENWFDGNLDSVDRRLAVCDKLLHQTRSAVGVGGFGNPSALERIASLEADHRGLTELRETFLSAGKYRHADFNQPTVGIGSAAGVEPGPTPGSIKEPGGPSFTPGPNVRYERDANPMGGLMDGIKNLLSSRDQRYVELEAAKILRANADCHDVEELVERTRRIAAVDTSTFSSARSRAVTEALSARVAQLAERRRRPTRTAAAPAVIQDFPSELMFL